MFYVVGEGCFGFSMGIPFSVFAILLQSTSVTKASKLLSKTQNYLILSAYTYVDGLSKRREWDLNPRDPDGSQAVRRVSVFCTSPGLLHSRLGDPGTISLNLQLWCFKFLKSVRGSRFAVLRFRRFRTCLSFFA